MRLRWLLSVFRGIDYDWLRPPWNVICLRLSMTSSV